MIGGPNQDMTRSKSNLDLSHEVEPHQLRYSFALLSKGTMHFYKDMHMLDTEKNNRLLSFPASTLSFVDTGISIENEEKRE